MPAWLDHIMTRLESNGEPVMLVTVASTAGSVPREAGARMVVGPGDMFGTIGGGQLEFEAIAEARSRLSGNRQSGIVVYPLGPELGQCCGGSVSVLFEDYEKRDLDHLKLLAKQAALAPAARAISLENGAAVVRAAVSVDDTNGSAADKLALDALSSGDIRLERDGDRILFAEPVREMRARLWLFGAGHVGKALAHALAGLPFKVTWVDSRADMFPGESPGNIHHMLVRRPELAVQEAPAGTYFLVMTHSHPLDQDICEAVLKRGDAAYLGLIGSNTKKVQFLRRLEAKGLTKEDLQNLVCPIGLPGIEGKAPAVIATSVAADLLKRAALD